MPRVFTVIRKRSDFLATAASGKKAVFSGLILQIRRNLNDPECIRYGLTASKRVGGAVIRNRARRRLRALAAGILMRHAASGYDYVLIARSSTPIRPWPELEKDLLAGLKRLGVFKV